ncbi:MAG: cytochrome c oxidase assembly protein [Thermoleophilia bacterium]
MRRRRLLVGLLAAVGALVAAPAALAHGDRVPIDELGSAWRFEPIVLALTALALALFGQAWWRLRRRGRSDHASWGRVGLFLAGMALLVLPVVSPLDAAGEEYLLSAHMLQHVLIGDAAPALLVVAIRGPLSVFLLPPVVLRPLARLRPVRTFFGELLTPRVAFTFWAATFAIWHVPDMYDAVLTNRLLHDLEHTMFVVAGLLVWTQLIDPMRHGRLRRSAKIGAAVGLFAMGNVLADVLLFARSAIYPAYAAQDERLFGFSPINDQQFAGGVMMIEQALTLGLFLMLFFLNEEQRERRDEEEPEPVERADEAAPPGRPVADDG